MMTETTIDIMNMAESCTQCDFEEPPSDIDISVLDTSMNDFYQKLDHQLLANEPLDDIKYFSC